MNKNEKKWKKLMKERRYPRGNINCRTKKTKREKKSPQEFKSFLILTLRGYGLTLSDPFVLFE